MVTCPSCQSENREGRRFCAECGSELMVACAACGTPNEPGAKFCGNCGGRLVLALPEPAAKGPAGERRQVTVMYVDLTGYTRLSELLDAEELHDTTGRVLDSVDRIVADFGGTVHRHVGDAVMALFGVPVAHGDDPYRAVASAFEIHKAMTALGAEVDHDLAVHIGIANGEVVVAEQGTERPKDVPEYAITGVAANLASRLNGMAGPRETIISDGVQRTVEARVDCEPLGDVAVKGLNGRVAAWRAAALRPSDGRGWQGGFVGRRAELGQFESVLKACRETSGGQTVVLRGEAGYGKTRLVEEFEAAAKRQGFACHKGLVLDFGVGKGRDAMASLVGALLGVPAGDDPRARQAAVQWALDEGLYEAEAQAFVNDLLGLAQPMALKGLYDAMDAATRAVGRNALVADLVRRVSGRQPRLLIVEDIHWADAEVLRYLARMTAAVQDCPAVLVMTSRIEDDPLSADWRAAAGSPLMTMDLGPLRDGEAIELAQQLSNRGDGFARRCVERAGGCPLFLEQLLRQAEESGEEKLPSTIQSLVLARMDALPERDKAALQAASVIGQRFPLEALRAMLAEPGYACATLVRQYLVRPEGKDYLFAHALIREGVYASLLKTTRSRLHLQAAAWLKERDAALYAEHLDRAADPAAPGAYLTAARVQSQDYRNERALQLAERGLSIARAPDDIAALACLKGEVLHDTGAIPEAVAAYEQALAAATRDEDRCHARIGLAAGMRMLDRFDDALDHLSQAEAVATARDLNLERSQIHYLRGNLCFPLGRIDQCVEEHEAAYRLARAAGSALAEVRALGGLGDAAYVRGRLLSARDYFVRCCNLARQQGFGRIEAANRPMVSITAFFALDIEGGLAEAQAATDFCIRIGQPRAEVIARHCLYFGHMLQGDIDKARAAIHGAQALTLRIGARRFEAENLMCLAEAAVLEGDRAGAVPLAEEAVAVSRETGMAYMGPACLGMLALATDDAGQREAAIAEGERLLAAGGISHNFLWFYSFSLDALLRAGDLSGAERCIEALTRYTASEPLAMVDFILARGRLLVARARGLHEPWMQDEAARLLAEARRVGLRRRLDELDALAAEGVALRP